MQHRRRQHRGFTLLELLVVAMLGTLVITFITNAWRWYSRSLNAMHVSAQLDRELKLAAQAIAADYGPALSVRTTSGSDVQFDFDNDSSTVAEWSDPDTVIEYVLQDGNLVRRNLNDSTQVPLARHISELTAEMVSGHLHVHLTASYRSTDQELTLQLRDPT